MVLDEGSASDSSEEESGMELVRHPNCRETALQYLKDRNIEVSASDFTGITPLMVAAFGDDGELLTNLLAAGEPANCVNAGTGDTALILSASLGHHGIVERLLAVQGIELNKANRNGDTALMLASSNNYSAVVRALLDQGADANLANCKRGYTALMLAADYGLQEIAAMLVDHPKIELNAANSGGDTALILAAAGKHAEVVRCLLEAKADVSRVDMQGYTALKAAIAAEDARIVEMLLDVDQGLDDFDPFSVSNAGFRIIVNDLVASKRTARSFVAPDDKMGFFRELAEQIPSNGDNLPLQRWLHGKGLSLAWAQELASLLAPAHAWALSVAKRTRPDVITQQRLIFCVGALGQLELGSSANNVQAIYRRLEISSAGKERLCGIANQQLAVLVRLAEEAAAQLGNELMNRLITSCLTLTSAKYEIRQDELRDRLVQDGFIEPLARVIASGWQATVAEIMGMTETVSQTTSLAAIIQHVNKVVVDNAQRMLVGEVKKNIRPHNFLETLQSTLMPARNDGVISDLYQVQHDWFSQLDQQLEQVKAAH